MKIVGQEKLFSFSDRGRIAARECFAVRQSKGCKVQDFLDLATKVATLQFLNPGQVLLFRGQPSDHKRSSSEGDFSTLKPNLFRGTPVPGAPELRHRFEKLKEAEAQLLTEYQEFGFPEPERLARQRILRWSIIQHYGICDTPLLDVSQSLRVAASFASDESPRRAYLMVLGVPNISGAITASAEAGLQIVRLASVCPPSALRPHIQEGYLLGEYPDMGDYDQKRNYGHFEIDFGRRLVAKFVFNPGTFWGNPDFPPVPHAALYPDDHDPLYEVAQTVRRRLGM
ncbi:FRG domain-containing protein [Mesorhizobium opportunistum]|uniref:FRG domain-containing protein n=1 Tax=Mesorhizobium opportunistum TaxID=593909 RepID=UPI003338F45E